MPPSPPAYAERASSFPNAMVEVAVPGVVDLPRGQAPDRGVQPVDLDLVLVPVVSVRPAGRVRSDGLEVEPAGVRHVRLLRVDPLGGAARGGAQGRATPPA